jgi:hypothetical protein
VPTGFDAERVHEAAKSLVSKRRRGVERSWPRLCAALGDTFRPRFEAWATRHPLGVEASALADGRRFAEALLAEGALPEAAREELFALDVRFRLTGDGLIPRRGVGVRAARLGSPRRLVLALRLPGGRILHVRLG